MCSSRLSAVAPVSSIACHWNGPEPTGWVVLKAAERMSAIRGSPSKCFGTMPAVSEYGNDARTFGRGKGPQNASGKVAAGRRLQVLKEAAEPGRLPHPHASKQDQQQCPGHNKPPHCTQPLQAPEKIVFQALFGDRPQLFYLPPLQM